MKIRLLFVLVLLVAGPAAGAAQASSSSYWSIAKLLHKLDGTRIRVGTHTVRIRASTTLCAGQGASIRRGGYRRWRRFICTYTTFTRSGIDRDLDFRVTVRGTRRYTITDAHWVTGSR